MRRFYSYLAVVTCLIAPVSVLPVAWAQSPAPSPSPTPASKPKPAEIPDPMTNLEHASKLTTPGEFEQSHMKSVPPLFNPEKEALFTVPSDYRKPGRLKIGAFFPSSKTLQKNTNDIFIMLGGSVDLPPHGQTRPFTTEVYFDAAFHAEKDANSASLIGLGYGYRTYPGAKPNYKVTRLTNPRFFFGAGLGIYLLKSSINKNSHSSVKPGGKLTVGLDFPEDWAIEANYTVTDKLNGVDFSGPAVELAYRF